MNSPYALLANRTGQRSVEHQPGTGAGGGFQIIAVQPSDIDIGAAGFRDAEGPFVTQPGKMLARIDDL